MGAPQLKTHITPREYYVRERAAETKHEYFAGEVYAMAGSSTRHSIICTNLGGLLWFQLKGKRCAPYDSNQRIKSKPTGLRCYPDASVFCGPLEYDDDDDQVETATNPAIVFEVLSKSTEAHDRGTKAESYRVMESLKAYVLISQERPHVEIQQQLEDGTWRLSWAAGLDAVLLLPMIEVSIPLAELYNRVEFDPTSAPQIP